MTQLHITGDPIIHGLSIAIGNFDGVHLGHQEVLNAAKSKGSLGVVSFAPNPKRHFVPDTPNFELMSDEVQCKILKSFGAKTVTHIAFNDALVEMSPVAFVDAIAAQFKPTHVSVGTDFQFGKDRAGNVEMLKTGLSAQGIEVTALPLLEIGGEKVSSTRIRKLLSDGEVKIANQLLGRPHIMHGIVAQGDQRGRDLGFPTANLYPTGIMLPKFGIYATRLRIHDGDCAGDYLGASSLGVRPSFGINKPNFETHILDFEGDIYGCEITVELIEYLRPEVKFEGIEKLIGQMALDVIQCRKILAELQNA